MTPFVHLHVHTQYSLLDGQASVTSLVDKAMADGMPGIAITDHGNMFGIKEFANYVNKKNGKTKGAIKDCEKEIAEAEAAGDTATAAEKRAEIDKLKKRFSHRFLAARCMWPTSRCMRLPTKRIQAGTSSCLQKQDRLQKPHQARLKGLDRGHLSPSPHRQDRDCRSSRGAHRGISMSRRRDTPPHRCR